MLPTDRAVQVKGSFSHYRSVDGWLPLRVTDPGV
jgi:hypothetical protein